METRHTRFEVVPSPTTPGVHILRCARCHIELTEWAKAAGTVAPETAAPN